MIFQEYRHAQQKNFLFERWSYLDFKKSDKDGQKVPEAGCSRIQGTRLRIIKFGDYLYFLLIDSQFIERLRKNKFMRSILILTFPKWKKRDILDGDIGLFP